MEKDKPYMIRCTGCRTKNRVAAEKINDQPICGKCRQPLYLEGLFSGRAVDVTDRTFEKEVMQSPIPVLLIFWASWCSACRSVLPIMDRIASSMRGRVKVARVNTEQNTATASRFDVMSIPLIIVFDNGVEKETLAGAASELEILKKIAPYY
jgi:thioredoxin 2